MRDITTVHHTPPPFPPPRLIRLASHCSTGTPCPVLNSPSTSSSPTPSPLPPHPWDFLRCHACSRALESFWRVCGFLTRAASQQVMGHPAHAAYGGGYGQYVQQQQHVDPQAAAYAQYMQQVASDYRHYVRLVTRHAVRFAVRWLPVSGCGCTVRTELCSRFGARVFAAVFSSRSTWLFSKPFFACFPLFLSAAAYAQQQPAAAYAAAPYRPQGLGPHVVTNPVCDIPTSL